MNDRRAAALNEIANLLGRDGVVTHPELQRPYLEDARSLYCGQAALIARPESVSQVIEIVRLCRDGQLAIVPQGGNTGYCGGASPDDAARQVLLNMGRLNRIRKIDSDGLTMTVDAGVILANARNSAREHDMYLPLSMGSEASCQIGGNVSTNAGGLNVVRYGTCKDQVLGLEVVLADGTLLSELKGLRKDNTGYDLKALFIGAEGTLGIVTGVVLKLFPRASSQETAFLAVPGLDSATWLLALARELSGDAVTSFEYLTRFSLDAVLTTKDGARDPLGQRWQHYVLLELQPPGGGEHLAALLEKVLQQGYERGLILDGTVAQSGSQRKALWDLREFVAEAEKRLGGTIKHDVSLPISALGAFVVSACEKLASMAPHRLSLYGHVGDGNLHMNLLCSEGDSQARFAAEEGVDLSAAINSLAVAMGGSFSAEHGIGKLKRNELDSYKSDIEMRLMRELKSALDPRGLFNPGKVLSPGRNRGADFVR